MAAPDELLTPAELAAVHGGEEKTFSTFVRDFGIPNTAAWITTIPCFAAGVAAVRKVKSPWIKWGVPMAADLVCDYGTGAATYFGATDKAMSAFSTAKSYMLGK